MSHGGKGDAMRPTDRQAFDAGIDRTFGVKKPWYVLRDEARAAQPPDCPHCGGPFDRPCTCDLTPNEEDL